MVMTYRVAIVGAGGIAERHLEALEEVAQLQPVAIADIQGERASELSAKYGLHPYTDYRRMIETEKPDIAIITLPHFLHREAAIFCSDHGCHILLEKPMALNVQECKDISEAVVRNKVKLMVGHTQHYIAENLKARELIEQGNLGQLVMIHDSRHVHYYQSARPDWFFHKDKAGGGILTNLGSHSIDKIQWLGRSKITKVKAHLTYYGTKGDVEGSAQMFLQNAEGISSTISQSGYLGASRNETELIFTKGMLRIITGQSLWISDGGEYRQVPAQQAAKPFVLQFHDLLDSIENDREPECSMEYSKGIVAVVDTLYRSHELNAELDVVYDD